MNLIKQHTTELSENGFTILEAVYTEQEIAKVIEAIAQANQELPPALKWVERLS